MVSVGFSKWDPLRESVVKCSKRVQITLFLFGILRLLVSVAGEGDPFMESVAGSSASFVDVSSGVDIGFPEVSQASFPGPSLPSGPREGEKEKRRTPAWTDRILWRSREPGVKLLSYGSAPLYASDHRPVSALFTLQVSPNFLCFTKPILDCCTHHGSPGFEYSY